MSLRLNTITVDSAAWEPLVEFWSQIGDFVKIPDNPNQAGDPEGMLRSADTGIELLFIPVPEAKRAKNRMHLDLSPDDGSTRDQEVERLLSLRASMYADHRRADGSGFAVLADPEGNEFCVERSVSSA